jgi:hypothetical protein
MTRLPGTYDNIAIGSDLDGYIKPALPGLERMGRMATFSTAIIVARMLDCATGHP